MGADFGPAFIERRFTETRVNEYNIMIQSGIISSLSLLHHMIVALVRFTNNLRVSDRDGDRGRPESSNNAFRG